MTRKRKRSGVLPNIFVSCLAIAVVFTAAEITIRQFYHPENLDNIIRFDPLLGWGLNPNTTLRSVDYARRFDYLIDINSRGMREHEFDSAKRPGRPRIVVLGDSFAFGTGVDAFWRFSDIMGRALREDAEVLNAAVCGYGTDQELLYYESFVRHLHPDVVILTMMMANDVVNNTLDHLFLETTPKPRFQVVEGQLQLEDRVLPAPPQPNEWNPKRILRRSRLLLFVKRRIDARRYRDHVYAVAHHSGLEEEWAKEAYSHWTVYEREPTTDLERGWAVTRAALEELATVCREDGTALIVLAFPIKIEVDSEWRGALFERAGVEADDYDLELPYRRLAEMCRSIEVPFLYPIDTFREAAERRPLYHTYDGHPNKYGHVVAARVLLDALKERQRLDFALDEMDLTHLADVKMENIH